MDRNVRTYITLANETLAIGLHFSVIACVRCYIAPSLRVKLLDITQKFTASVKILTCTMKVPVSNLGPDNENFRAPTQPLQATPGTYLEVSYGHILPHMSISPVHYPLSPD